MPCYHPLKAIKVPFQNRPKILPRRISDQESAHWVSRVDPSTGEYFPEFLIPCGQCIGCRLEYSRRWADRIMMDASGYESNYFVTLTYDDEHLPCPKEGKILSSLVPRDLELFMKRLRSHFYEQHIRFFAAGEYGEASGRPHYHLCLLNMTLDDLVFYKSNPLGNPLYTSSTLDNVWSKGYCVVAPLEWNTAAYTARYCLKKQRGKGASDFYDRLGVIPEFVRMSRRPGLGRDYIIEHKQSYIDHGSVFLPASGGKSHRSPTPPYFDRIFSDSDPRAVALSKVARSDRADIHQLSTFFLHGYSEREYLGIEERSLEEKLRACARTIE